MTEFWESTLAETVRISERLTDNPTRSQDVTEWLGRYLEGVPTSSNQGTANLPFQRWFHFKEAFSPKFVADTLGSLPYKVESCVDPFGGSGTTALTCRMLGIASTSVEVNPFLADLIEAKLSTVAPAAFCASYERLIKNLETREADQALAPGMPRTMVAPGMNDRYVFPRDVYTTARAIARQSNDLLPDYARLVRVLLGSVLVSNSNVVINGKGRRYRRGWQTKQRSCADLIESLDAAIDVAAADITRFSGLPRGRHSVIRGDARVTLGSIRESSVDVAIFSPPYPNSFDYTDVYNLELWILGYLNSGAANRDLRHDTLRSHVQMKWHSTPRFAVSEVLDKTLAALRQVRADLWNPNIPEMVGFYFDDLCKIFQHLKRILRRGRHAVVAIGDSQYASIHVDVASILIESLSGIGFRLTEQGAIRSMRNSSQHGGSFELSEHCLVFERL
ncbi:site-specific DNA-methyltransferase [Mesorhizobium sp. BR1-1-15]|uniref:site-specific DNA-methyltransferase n=1 Tax=Mesorhizobium sp. BR1-1-15 TaxID=2876654 RepID=UPI001CCAB8CF|nr:site-specific DNA-methyltransferase [Mesorhizobium sp. BR1-1-15]MBZ9953958.1 site-specific DNA-methyltransferase [Mesorhizobium sp. BR1-1-15]